MPHFRDLRNQAVRFGRRRYDENRETTCSATAWEQGGQVSSLLLFWVSNQADSDDRLLAAQHPDFPLPSQPQVDRCEAPLGNREDPSNGPCPEQIGLEPHAREVLRQEPLHVGVGLALGDDELLLSSFSSVPQDVRTVCSPRNPRTRREEWLLLHGVTLLLKLPPDDQFHPSVRR